MVRGLATHDMWMGAKIYAVFKGSRSLVTVKGLKI